MFRVHLFLLRLVCVILPASFRAEYLREITLLFRQEYAESKGRQWISLLPDLVETALRSHWELLVTDFRSWLWLVKEKKLLAAGLIGGFAASIALASAMFSVSYTLLLRSLPYEDPERLVKLENFPTLLAQNNPGLVREWLKTQNAFEDLAYHSSFQANLDGENGPVRVEAAHVSASFFGVFGQSLLLGNSFDDENLVVLGHGVWLSQFGGDPRVVGKLVRVSGKSLRVSGVMRPGFDFPNKTGLWTHTSAATLLELAEEQQALIAFVTARLKKGVSYAQAADASMALSVQLVGPEARQYAKSVTPLQRALTEQIRQPVAFLTVAAGLLLLLGCGSATGLLTARNVARRRDLAIRFALGANGSRIRRQSLMEGVLFAMCGALLGTCGGYLLVRMVPASVMPAGIGEINVDQAVLVTGILSALACGALTGWAAGWNATMRYEALPHESWTSTVIGGSQFQRRLLASQIALSVALLVWAGLQMKSLVGLMRADLGFDPEHLVAATVSFKGSPYRTVEQRRIIVERWQRRIETIPGGKAAAISMLPMRRAPLAIRSYQVDSSSTVRAVTRMVSPEFLKVAGGSIIEGRDFGAGEGDGAVMVNESFVNASGISAAEAIGMSLGKSRIIGVYRRQATFGPQYEAMPEVSTSMGQTGPTFLSLLVRVPGRPVDNVDMVRAAIHAETPDVTVFEVRPMSVYVSEKLADQRLYTTILGMFAGLSCLTSLAGLVSLVLFYVSSRQRELGIRMALGATGWGVMHLVVRHGLPLLVAGALFGEALAIAGGKGMASLLVRVEPLDAGVHAAIGIGLLLCGLIVMIGAGWKASRIDPSVALKSY